MNAFKKALRLQKQADKHAFNNPYCSSKIEAYDRLMLETYAEMASRKCRGVKPYRSGNYPCQLRIKTKM